jgi:glycosyltransferase involved in cell wall biosynthesis
MGEIVMADDGVTFDGLTLREGPLGGSETAFTLLAEAFARRGHRVIAGSNTKRSICYEGVEWMPLWSGNFPDSADLYIACRGHRVIPLVPRAKSAVFWIHNPAQYLLKWRYLWRLWRRGLPVVFVGDYHTTTYPQWALGRRIAIPLGIDEPFRHASERSPPPPRAIFTSNPLRGLDWLLDIWSKTIRLAVPNAELHLFTGSTTYRDSRAAPTERAGAVLEKAKNMAGSGVVLRDPVAHDKLVGELEASRVMLYRGDVGETFCLALAEAQAVGVPAVVMPIGSMAERIVDGVTGFVARDEKTFADNAIRLLTDDGLWQSQHCAALARQRSRSWDMVAADFERLMS